MFFFFNSVYTSLKLPEIFDFCLYKKNFRPDRPTHKLPEYGELFALQTDESCKGVKGSFWNLCTRAHTNQATPLLRIRDFCV